MSTRGQHGQDTIQRMIQETEEQKKYELEQQNNTLLNKAIKSVPLGEIRTLNTALKITNSQVQSTLANAQKTVTEVSKSNAAIQTTSASVNEANKSLAQATKAAELMKEFAPVMGGLSLATLPSTFMNMARDSIKTRNNHEALVKGMNNGTVKSGQVAGSIMHNTAGTIMKTAGIGAAGSFAHDMFTGGVMGGTTKALLGMSSPGMMASGMMGGIGGLGGLVGATGGLAIPAGIALMIGAQILNSKLGKHLDSKNPLNKQNSLRLATNINYRSITTDPLIQSERMVAKSKIQVLGPNGLGVLTQGELIHASLLTDIVANTSILDNIYEEIINKSEINNKKSNDAVNKSALAFGGSSQDGLEFNSLANDGKLNSMQKFLLGLSGFNTQVGNLYGAIGNFYNFKGSNKGAWVNRDAYLVGGDPDKAQKLVAKRFNITMSESALLSMNIQTTLESIDDPESRKLATLIGIFNLNRLSAKKLVEIAKASGAESFIGAQAAADKQAAKEQDARHSFWIDSVLRPLDEAIIQKIPGIKLLSNLGHMSSGIIGGISSLAGGLGNIATGKGTGWWNEMKAAFQDERLDNTVKNEELLRSQIGMKELDDTALAMAYLARTYPGKFDQLLSKFGITTNDSYTDKYTGDRISKEELSLRNKERYKKLESSLNEQLPNETITEYLKQATLGKYFNKNREKDILGRYSHLKDMKDELENPKFIGSDIDPDERGIKMHSSSGSTLEEMFREFSRKYDENTAKGWDHCWLFEKCVCDQKDTNYGKIQTAQEIAKALATTLSSDSNKNLASSSNSLNDQMSGQERLNREEMVALSIIKYLPYLENIYENTKKEEEIKKFKLEPDDGKGIFDHLGDLFGGFGSLIGLGGLGGLLSGKLGNLVKTMKAGISKKLSKFVGKGLLGGLASRLLAGIGAVALSPLAPVVLGIASVGLAVFSIYSIFEEEIDAMMSSIWDWFSDMMPETAKWIEEKVAAFKGLFSSENLQNLTGPTANTSNPAETEGANGANDDVTRESYAAEMEQKRLDKKIKEKFKDDPNIALKLQESKTIDILKQTQDTASLAFQQNTEHQEKLLKNIIDQQDQNSKVFKETLEKSSMATTANVEAIISNAKLNGIIGQVVAESLSNNKETYTLDYNIALPFGRNAFGINVNNYVK